MTGCLVELDLTPLQIRRFQLARPTPQTLARESRDFEVDIELTAGRFTVS